MDLAQHLISERAALNAERLVGKLVSYLSNHEAYVTHKIDGTEGRCPDSLLYYTTRLDEYYLSTVDQAPSRFNNIDEHFKDIVSYLFYDDLEYSITLVSGLTEIPPHIIVNLTIPDTFYEADKKDFPEFSKHPSWAMRI